MVYGGIYYSILVGKNKQSEGALKYVVSVLVAFISSIFIAILVQATSSTSLLEGAIVGGDYWHSYYYVLFEKHIIWTREQKEFYNCNWRSFNYIHFIGNDSQFVYLIELRVPVQR
ncbi:hypothetical protein ACXYMX_16565 [Sporosarcina sp. CAU 1771]